jgi:peptide/nickel transport system permease protein
MSTYLLRRLLLIPPTLLVITFISYGLMRLAPGDPLRAQVGYMGGGGEEAGVIREQEGLSEAAQVFRRRYHLDKHFVIGYGHWLWGILRHGDFGESITIRQGAPMGRLLAERIPPTLKLNLWAMIVVYLVAVPIGIHAAVRRGSLLDRASATTLFMLYSLPSFWVGLLLIMLVSRYAPAWPIRGLTPAGAAGASYWALLGRTAQHYVLPVFCLSYAGLAGLSRYARVGLLEVWRQDYIRTARAKGCGEWRVVFKHALRNGVIPLVVVMAGMLPGLIGGSIIIEYLFQIQGMGSLSIEAVSNRDYPVVMTLFGLSALLTLLGLLLSDLALALLDPRISYDRRA